ncbi:ABC transporter ATP-binding protein [Ruegeria pomeroyi]|nr:ABC transporter ATP-binding protein [Ruegeria pomeroyi]
MLKIENLNAHYGLAHVLQGVSLQAERGDVIGIFGRNGVGKTTFLKTIAGWVKPSGGCVAFDETELTGLEADAMNRAGFGFVPEDRRIFPGLTVEENLRLGLLGRRGKGGSSLDQAFDRFPRLAERRHQAGNTLSGGEQQMLAMARVLLAEPSVVLVDEPSEGLAPMIVAEVFAIIREMSAAGSIVLLVEQNIHEALAVCDRFIALERGAVVLDGNGSSETDRKALLKELAV